MRLCRLIASGLLFTVLFAPVMGLAICVSPASSARACCPSHCAHQSPASHQGWTAALPHGSAGSPLAPCCERNVPPPALGESSAQIVAPVQVALLPASASHAMFASVGAPRVERLSAPPSLAPPFSLLCTLLI